MTVKGVGEKWGITGRIVNYYCSSGRIKGAIRKGSLWLVTAMQKNLGTQVKEKEDETNPGN